jgi:hypothetical protein
MDCAAGIGSGNNRQLLLPPPQQQQQQPPQLLLLLPPTLWSKVPHYYRNLVCKLFA